MPTVVKTIGSGGGRDYSTLAGWAASLPANLITDGNSYRGECYNDSEFFSSSGYLVYINGNTTDASHTITLTTGTGQSFRDNAAVQSNALKYNVANGVGLRTTTTDAPLYVGDGYVTISNLQILAAVGSRPAVWCYPSGTAAGADFTLNDCLLSSDGGSSGVIILGSNAKLSNTVLIAEAAMTLGAVQWASGAGGGSGNTLAFLTIVTPSDVTNTASYALSLAGVTATTVLENIAVFGFANILYDPNTAAASTTCMTDLAGIAGWTGSRTYGSQFQNTTDAAQDWRAQAGADLQGAGTADSTNGAHDIAGTSRPQSGNWDIGCWEFLASGTIVIADSWGLVGYLAEHRVACRSRWDLVATQRADPRLVLDLSVVQDAGLRARLEWKASLRQGLDMEDEFGSGVADTSASFIELSAQFLADWDVVAESEGAIISLLIDGSVLPVEWSARPVTVRVSLERLLASPGKRRILGTPGRLRLLKRD